MNLAISESSAGGRRLVYLSSCGMVAVALAMALIGRTAGRPVISVLPTVTGGVIVAELMSAYIIFSEFAKSRTRWLPFIGAAYGATALLAVPYLLTFPRVFVPHGLFGASDQTALELWMLWHIAFPTLVLLAVTAGMLPSDRRISCVAAPRVAAGTIGGCMMLAFAAPLLLIRYGTALPVLFDGTAFTPAAIRVVLPVIMVADAAALAVLFRRTGNRQRIAAWLFVALVASSLDTFLGLVCARYSTGWYAGKAFMMLSSTVMLGAFIREAAHLRGRLGCALEEVQRSREREHHLAQERLARVTSYDVLTGLPNRSHIEDQLRDLALPHKSHQPFAVLFISIDGVKAVNEQFGHAASDALLNEIAARLRKLVRASDALARFSAAEFVVVAGSVSSISDAETLGNALASAFRVSYDVDADAVMLNASVGVALYPEDAATTEELLDRADAAAQQARRVGANAVCAYSREFAEEARSRRRLQDELSSALLHDEFVLHYQPIVHLRSGALAKVEALIRWTHPQRGLVYPDSFIPTAEQTGLMCPIGYWVTGEAVRQASQWLHEGTPCRIAVNVSARQLEDAGFFEHLRELLRSTGLPPNLLELEITESAAMTDASLAQDELTRCRTLGVEISLDDFGTYYSSLTYLKRLPIDTVKIDQSFVQGLPFNKSDATIVSGIIGLARGLGRKLVAEGVESEEQRSWLLKAGCDYGQGYLFGRAMTVEALTRWRSARQREALLV
jgi:diguanylate cyclase (GGDEF)-like protein